MILIGNSCIVFCQVMLKPQHQRILTKIRNRKVKSVELTINIPEHNVMKAEKEEIHMQSKFMILVKPKDTTLYYNYITVKFVEKKSTQLQVEIVDGYEADKLKNDIFW